MLVTLEISIFSRLEQRLNTPFSISVTDFIPLTVVRPEQLIKAYAPIVVTLSGSVIFVRLLQFSKAYCGIVSRPLGNFTDVSAEQPENTRSAKDVTVSGISTVSRDVLFANNAGIYVVPFANSTFASGAALKI